MTRVEINTVKQFIVTMDEDTVRYLIGVTQNSMYNLPEDEPKKERACRETLFEELRDALYE